MILFFAIIALLLSALFSGSEIAFVSGNPLRVELRKKRGGRRGTILARFYDNPSGFIGTMLTGNNIALVAFSSLMSTLLEPYLLPWVYANEVAVLLVNTLLITLIVLVFGEYLPKAIGRLFSDEALYILAVPLEGLRIALNYPSRILNGASNRVLTLALGRQLEEEERAFTRLDLEKFVEETQLSEEVEEIDRELFGKALNLKDVRTREAMIPRNEIVSIDVNASTQDLENIIRETHISRLVVVDGEIDKVLGYVHHQQLLNRPKSIRSLIMPLIFVPEAMRITDLLSRCIKERQNIAMVVDEFGGISGLITLEDVLEEIFGEIEDEHDQEEHIEKIVGKGEWLFSGRLEISYLNEKFNLRLPEGDYHTLSGFLVMTTESIPTQGEEIILNGYRFLLESVSKTKIEKVRVIEIPQAEDQ